MGSLPLPPAAFRTIPLPIGCTVEVVQTADGEAKEVVRVSICVTKPDWDIMAENAMPQAALDRLRAMQYPRLYCGQFIGTEAGRKAAGDHLARCLWAMGRRNPSMPEFMLDPAAKTALKQVPLPELLREGLKGRAWRSSSGLPCVNRYKGGWRGNVYYPPCLGRDSNGKRTKQQQLVTSRFHGGDEDAEVSCGIQLQLLLIAVFKELDREVPRNFWPFFGADLSAYTMEKRIAKSVPKWVSKIEKREKELKEQADREGDQDAASSQATGQGSGASAALDPLAAEAEEAEEAAPGERRRKAPVKAAKKTASGARNPAKRPCRAPPSEQEAEADTSDSTDGDQQGPEDDGSEGSEASSSANEGQARQVLGVLPPNTLICRSKRVAAQQATQLIGQGIAAAKSERKSGRKSKRESGRRTQGR